MRIPKNWSCPNPDQPAAPNPSNRKHDSSTLRPDLALRKLMVHAQAIKAKPTGRTFRDDNRASQYSNRQRKFGRQEVI